MIEETIKTGLEWVVFSEESEGDDTCQKMAFDCPNEAVAVVTWNRECCHGPLRYCVSCTGYQSGFLNKLHRCGRCKAEGRVVTSIRPIRGGG